MFECFETPNLGQQVRSTHDVEHANAKIAKILTDAMLSVPGTAKRAKLEIVGNRETSIGTLPTTRLGCGFSAASVQVGRNGNVIIRLKNLKALVYSHEYLLHCLVQGKGTRIPNKNTKTG